MSRTDKAKAELQKLLGLFESGDVPDAVAKVLLPARDVPCAKWSLSNRMLCLLHGTDDARGFRQWEKAGRHVKKGCHALYILAPRMVKRKADETAGKRAGSASLYGLDPKQEPTHVLIGFKAVPVFRYEDTDGEALNRADYDPPELPPLYDVAGRFGVSVEYLGPGMDATYYGCYRPQAKAIRLCTHHESTFFHELAHAANLSSYSVEKGADRQMRTRRSAPFSTE